MKTIMLYNNRGFDLDLFFKWRRFDAYTKVEIIKDINKSDFFVKYLVWNICALIAYFAVKQIQSNTLLIVIICSLLFAVASVMFYRSKLNVRNLDMFFEDIKTVYFYLNSVSVCGDINEHVLEEALIKKASDVKRLKKVCDNHNKNDQAFHYAYNAYVVALAQYAKMERAFEEFAGPFKSMSEYEAM